MNNINLSHLKKKNKFVTCLSTSTSITSITLLYIGICVAISYSGGRKTFVKRSNSLKQKIIINMKKLFIVQSILVNSKFHCLIRESLNDLYVVSTLKIGFKITNWYTNLKKKKNAHFKKFNLRTIRWDKKYIDIQKKNEIIWILYTNTIFSVHLENFSKRKKKL